MPHRSLAELAKAYGPLMLLKLGQLPTLVVSSANMAEQVLKVNDLAFSSRSPLIAVKRLSYGYSNVSFSPYGTYWLKVRKILSQIGRRFFSMEWVNYLTGRLCLIEKNFARWDEFLETVIADHLLSSHGEAKEEEDFVDVLLQLQREETPDFTLTTDQLNHLS
ncbi:hypothetical protein AMTR_s00049p00220990 [Amborella trichopoda]|uniref:Cytochrome P450 n=1 Tax=Amborella trichopoda TaxID=13333 RepID=W1Q030_AMBTC|nr:hypothetical protein AMTR_s00049p00220990 [Amborella trichopoda]